MASIRNPCVLDIMSFSCFNFLPLQRPHSIQNRDHRHTHICEHCFPHIGRSKCAHDQNDQLYAQSEYDILHHDPQSTAGNADDRCDLSGVIIHKNNIRSLDRRI